jgi:hypothetical protein
MEIERVATVGVCVDITELNIDNSLERIFTYEPVK